MKASEFIQRLQDLIEVNGDVEVIIVDEKNELFECASAESQNCIKVGNKYSNEYNWPKDCPSILTLIKVF